MKIPNDSHKSFYGKAKVYVSDDGTETLYSRDRNGKLKRL